MHVKGLSLTDGAVFWEPGIMNFCSMSWSCFKSCWVAKKISTPTAEGCLGYFPCDSEHPYFKFGGSRSSTKWLRFFLLAIFLAHFLAAMTFIHQHRMLNAWWRLPRFIAILLTSTAAWTLGRTRNSGIWQKDAFECGQNVKEHDGTYMNRTYLSYSNKIVTYRNDMKKSWLDLLSMNIFIYYHVFIYLFISTTLKTR